MNMKKDVVEPAKASVETASITERAVVGGGYRFGSSMGGFYSATGSITPLLKQASSWGRFLGLFSGRTFPIIPVLGFAVALCYLAVMVVVVKESEFFFGRSDARDAESLVIPAQAVSIQR